MTGGVSCRDANAVSARRRGLVILALSGLGAFAATCSDKDLLLPAGDASRTSRLYAWGRTWDQLSVGMALVTRMDTDRAPNSFCTLRPTGGGKRGGGIEPVLNGANVRRISGYALWLGHVGDARDFRSLIDVGIEAIVDLAVNEPPLSPPRERIYLRFPLVDGEGNIAGRIRLAVDSLASLILSGVPTLVYCSAGMSRTPCIAAAALARIEGVPVAPMLARVTTDGPADVSSAFWDDVLAALHSG